MLPGKSVLIFASFNEYFVYQGPKRLIDSALKGVIVLLTFNKGII